MDFELVEIIIIIIIIILIYESQIMFYEPLVHGSEPENNTRAAATPIAVDGNIILLLWFDKKCVSLLRSFLKNNFPKLYTKLFPMRFHHTTRMLIYGRMIFSAFGLPGELHLLVVLGIYAVRAGLVGYTG